MAGVQVLLSLLCLSSAQAGKLLVVPMDGSHWIGMKPVVQELGKRGHQVVVVIPEVSMTLGSSERTTTITYPVPFTEEEMYEDFKAGMAKIISQNLVTDLDKLRNFILLLDIISEVSVRNSESLLFNKTLMQKLKDWEFDAVLTDPFEPTGAIIAEYFSIPSIFIQVNLACGVDFPATQCPSPPSYIPQRYTFYTDQMSLWQRTVNLMRNFLQPMACRYLYSRADEIASRFLQRETSMVEIMSRATIWLMRSDFAFEFPRPVMPNMVMIGGISAAKPKPLPQDLEEFVNGSGEHGFVVFTLGSMVSELPEVKAKEFFDAFRQIPQRVLWRYTGVVPKDAPKNVRLMKWLPQNDLLAHPKAKAFITHGGTHGLYEGICNGVPMVMIPLFGDQGDNVQRMVARGVAETLNIYDITSEKLLVALRKVINDKSYKEKMMKLSAIHRDRPIEPLDLAVFWTEFVMRHKGADHLRPAAHDLNWVQYHSLDVIGFLLLILVTVIFVTFKSCVFCFRRCLRKSHKKKKE
ncbi:UDP-glucuronosyltransferase 1A5-like isoform X6 [Colossoma macropomum]|uniref:UDP-glucuronosyltransferase 1A5-like isoform X6 n=1 Tax=Colossoma macropomum TaxID=42526 RepID=UPI0018648501|nr:UDP-glucuronosyltransferase 1A5-like isoform X6 [Colossoma macropomum]